MVVFISEKRYPAGCLVGFHQPGIPLPALSIAQVMTFHLEPSDWKGKTSRGELLLKVEREVTAALQAWLTICRLVVELGVWACRMFCWMGLGLLYDVGCILEIGWLMLDMLKMLLEVYSGVLDMFGRFF